MSDDYNIAAIRRLLTAAFESAELRSFCLDRPPLRPIVARFGSGMGLDNMVDEVIDFCRTHLAWDDLLVGVKEERPAQYTLFEPELGGASRGVPSPAGPVIKILLLAANPRDTNPLRLDQEARAIDEALRKAAYRDRFELISHWAVQVADLQGLLLRHQPHIVHFGGHGSASSAIILEDTRGRAQAVPARALTGVFAALKDSIRCVVLNACYSEAQAQAIATEIDCVIGMSWAIGDRAAIEFAASFYQALAYGRSVKTAFDLGCLQIDMQDLAEQDTPQLKTRPGVTAEAVFLYNALA